MTIKHYFTPFDMQMSQFGITTGCLRDYYPMNKIESTALYIKIK